MAPDAEKQANKTTMGLQGQQTDPATALVDANTRMYDPSMGRFTTMGSVFGRRRIGTGDRIRLVPRKGEGRP